jgi:hypothetical protein
MRPDRQVEIHGILREAGAVSELSQPSRRAKQYREVRYVLVAG